MRKLIKRIGDNITNAFVSLILGLTLVLGGLFVTIFGTLASLVGIGNSSAEVQMPKRAAVGLS